MPGLIILVLFQATRVQESYPSSRHLHSHYFLRLQRGAHELRVAMPLFKHLQPNDHEATVTTDSQYVDCFLCQGMAGLMLLCL